MTTREDWRKIDLERLAQPWTWPNDPLPVKRDEGDPRVGILFSHETTVRRHDPPHSAVAAYGSVEELAEAGWRPD